MFLEMIDKKVNVFFLKYSFLFSMVCCVNCTISVDSEDHILSYSDRKLRKVAKYYF